MFWYVPLDERDVPAATRRAAALGVRRACAIHGLDVPAIQWVQAEGEIERRYRANFGADWPAWAHETPVAGWFQPKTPDRIYLVGDVTEPQAYESAAHEVDHMAQALAPETGPVLAFSWPGEKTWEAGEQRARNFGQSALADLLADRDMVKVRVRLGSATITTTMSRDEAERRGVEILDEQDQSP